jgi:hypothetical protein
MWVKGWNRRKILYRETFVLHTQGVIQLSPQEQNPPTLWFLSRASSIFKYPTHPFVNRKTVLLSKVAKKSVALLSVQYLSALVSWC